MSAALQTAPVEITSLDRLTSVNPTSDDLRYRAGFWRKYMQGADLTIEQEARIAQNCFYMVRLADQMDNPAPIAVLVPAKSIRKIAKPIKPAAVTAEQFWQLHAQAVSAIWSVYGERWYSHAPLTETVCATVPAKLCSMTGKLGGKIKWRRDWRLPTAKYWPNATIPGDLEYAPPITDQGPLPGTGVAEIVAAQIILDKRCILVSKARQRHQMALRGGISGNHMMEYLQVAADIRASLASGLLKLREVSGAIDAETGEE